MLGTREPRGRWSETTSQAACGFLVPASEVCPHAEFINPQGHPEFSISHPAAPSAFTLLWISNLTRPVALGGSLADGVQLDPVLCPWTRTPASISTANPLRVLPLVGSAVVWLCSPCPLFNILYRWTLTCLFSLVKRF